MALVEHHRRAVELLWTGADDAPDEQDDDASQEALAALFDDLENSDIRAEEGHPLSGRFVDYPTFFTALAKQRSLSPSPRSTHRRLKILGLLEARLLSVDRVVLGGLDEGTWPPRTVTDAFLNRPMRARVGLMPPERRIGQTAHDFVQALGTHDVVITRAHEARRLAHGALALPAAAQGLHRQGGLGAHDEGRRVLSPPRAHPRHAGARAAVAAPAAEARSGAVPARLSASPRSRSWCAIPTRSSRATSSSSTRSMPSPSTPSAAERGTIIHDVLGTFAEQYPKALPAHAQEILLALGTDAFAEIAEAYPELYAEWWPRFTRLATEFVVWEQNRRADLVEIYAERSGRLSIPLPDGTIFNLRARADRIEHRRDGGFTIVDFKTGQPPGVKEVYAGFSPQLTLEAMMLMKGAFKGLPMAKETPDLIYVHTTGGREPIKPREIGPTGKEDAPRRGDRRGAPPPLRGHDRALREGRSGVCLAALPEICPPLLGIRSSGAREGMVAGERGRRRGLRMSTDLVIPDYTKDAQRRAANPRASAWVSANAGAGKTKVLTDRVVRLLLAGSLPGRILCLTFTKAAAANMAIRVFERLGRWVTLDEDSLVKELTELEGAKPTRAQVKLARTLFARAVETPGGLKIDTIHAFCERLLHLVPFEANVPARFAVLDESQTDEMLAQATSNVMADAASGNFPELAEALDIVSVDAVGDALAAAIDAALKCKRVPARSGRPCAASQGARPGAGRDARESSSERCSKAASSRRTGLPSRRNCSPERRPTRNGPPPSSLPPRPRTSQTSSNTTSRSSSRMAVRRARARPSSPRMSARA